MSVSCQAVNQTCLYSLNCLRRDTWVWEVTCSHASGKTQPEYTSSCSSVFLVYPVSVCYIHHCKSGGLANSALWMRSFKSVSGNSGLYKIHAECWPCPYGHCVQDVTSNTQTTYCGTLPFLLCEEVINFNLERVSRSQNCVSGIQFPCIVDILKAGLYLTVGLQMGDSAQYPWDHFLAWRTFWDGSHTLAKDARLSAEPDGVMSFCWVCSWSSGGLTG